MIVLLRTCLLVGALFILSSKNAAAAPVFATPQTGGTWMTTGSMHVARVSPVAVTLPNGKVFVAGGFNNPNSFASAELWDTATGTWSRTGSMSVDRVGATLTVLHLHAVDQRTSSRIRAGAPRSSGSRLDRVVKRWDAPTLGAS